MQGSDHPGGMQLVPPCRTVTICFLLIRHPGAGIQGTMRGREREMRVGVVGAGAMRAAMAGHMLREGHDACVSDPSADRAEKALQAGLKRRFHLYCARLRSQASQHLWYRGPGHLTNYRIVTAIGLDWFDQFEPAGGFEDVWVPHSD